MRPAERTREPATTNCDALMLMADALLARDNRERASGTRFQIMVNVDAEVLAGDAEGTCELDGGPALAPETRAPAVPATRRSLRPCSDAVDRAVPTSQKAPTIPAATRRRGARP